MVGKQKPPPLVPAPSQKRNVKSHKDPIAGVVWTLAEQEQIDSAQGWREQQQFQKVLLHNRTAEERHLHKISLGRTNGKFVCLICSRKKQSLQTFS